VPVDDLGVLLQQLASGLLGLIQAACLDQADDGIGGGVQLLGLPVGFQCGLLSLLLARAIGGRLLGLILLPAAQLVLLAAPAVAGGVAAWLLAYPPTVPRRPSA